jgi:hypothetical protein
MRRDALLQRERHIDSVERRPSRHLDVIPGERTTDTEGQY